LCPQNKTWKNDPTSRFCPGQRLVLLHFYLDGPTLNPPYEFKAAPLPAIDYWRVDRPGTKYSVNTAFSFYNDVVFANYRGPQNAYDFAPAVKRGAKRISLGMLFADPRDRVAVQFHGLPARAQLSGLAKADSLEALKASGTSGYHVDAEVITVQMVADAQGKVRDLVISW
jgi:hypothetical protein